MQSTIVLGLTFSRWAFATIRSSFDQSFATGQRPILRVASHEQRDRVTSLADAHVDGAVEAPTPFESHQRVEARRVTLLRVGPLHQTAEKDCARQSAIRRTRSHSYLDMTLGSLRVLV